MQSVKIVLVEDDELASSLITSYLKEHDFEVESFFTVTDAIAHLKQKHFDLVLLDINLPDFSGYELLKSIHQTHAIPVIITSAYSDTKHKLMAFKYGASDYMVKPLDLEELEARIWVHLSRHSEVKSSEERKLFELQEREIYFKGDLLDLTTIEFEIFALLLNNKQQTLSRDKLLQKLSSLSSHRSLDNHIKNIRKKIGEDGNKTNYIRTEYGVGYRIVF